MEVGVIKIIVTEIIRGLPNTTSTINQHFPKTAVLWSQGIRISKVPFTEDCGGIAGGGKVIGHGFFIGAQQGSTHDGVPDTGAR